VLRNWFWPAFFGLFVLAGAAGAGWVAWKMLQAPAVGPRFTEKKFVNDGTIVHNLNSADGVQLPDSVQVIGVMVGDQPRAYVLRSLTGKVEKSLLHDRSGSNPVAVTFCDRTQTVRVFGGSDQRFPDVQIGGWRADQTMELLIDGVGYSHHSKSLPIPELSAETTSWGAWKEAHPDSRIYTGRD
jgi:hypothetical protein